MTIIAAMWESDDSILIAADSGLTDTGSGLPDGFEKLQRHINPKVPLAWGTAGDHTIGTKRFSKWLQSYEWPPKDRNLERFQEDVKKKLNSLNGKKRKDSKSVGIEAQADDLAEVLVVGYLDKPFIFHVDDRGDYHPYDREDIFYAIGSGRLHMNLVFTAFYFLTNEEKRTILDKHFWAIVNIASQKAPNCQPPVHMWRVNRDGITPLS